MTPLYFNYPISIAILCSNCESQDAADANSLARALQNRGHKVRIFEVNKHNWRQAVRLSGQVVFNLVEDPGWKLYTQVGETLEKLGRAQVGHDMKSFRYAVRKSWVKKRMYYLGISTPNFRVINRRSKITHIRGLEYPLIVKPSCEHAGIGISQDSVVIDADELSERIKYLFSQFPGEVVVEEFIDGREINVTLLGNGRRIVALPYAERMFTGEFENNWEVYGYDAKWVKSSWENWSVFLNCPTTLGKKVDAKIEKLAIACFRAFSCRDIARLDVRIDKFGTPYVLDVNMNPGIDMARQEETWRSAEALGWSYEEFIETIVATTYKRVYGRLPDRLRERQFLLSQRVS